MAAQLYDPDLSRIELMEFKPVQKAVLQRFHRRRTRRSELAYHASLTTEIC